MTRVLSTYKYYVFNPVLGTWWVSIIIPARRCWVCNRFDPLACTVAPKPSQAGEVAQRPFSYYRWGNWGLVDLNNKAEIETHTPGQSMLFPQPQTAASMRLSLKLRPPQPILHYVPFLSFSHLSPNLKIELRYSNRTSIPFLEGSRASSNHSVKVILKDR